MIKATFTRDKDGNIVSFLMKGHADFDEHGKDLVCAGASAVAFGSVNAIMLLTKVEPVIDLGSDGGYFKVVIPEKLDTATRSNVQLLLEAMLVSLQTIENDYAKYIKIIQFEL